LGDQTRQHYLFALILEQLPPLAPQTRNGFATLRLWLLVQGVERALAGNVQDRHLHTVARPKAWTNLTLSWHCAPSSSKTPPLPRLPTANSARP
jgi:hypothetical protein